MRAALPANSVRHIIVIELENESFSSTFGPGSPAVYLNHTLVPQGELIEHYYATGHVSLDNYIAQISGQAPNPLSSSDCATVSKAGLNGMFVNVVPGTLDPDQVTFPGQVDGTGCVYPSSVSTIPNQLDAVKGNPGGVKVPWRVYEEDMGKFRPATAGRPTRWAEPIAPTRLSAAATPPIPL